jgi:hypothetical protein
MDNSPKAVGDRQSILRYFEIIKSETDSLRRRIISAPSAEETAKQVKGPEER